MIAYTGDRDQYGFPSHLLDNDEKGYQWILQYVKTAFDNARQNAPDIFYFNRDKYYLIQDYAMGQQPVDIYKSQMGVSESDRNSYVNINWNPLPVLGALRQAALNKLNKVGYNVSVYPLDPLAEEEKSKWYAKQKARLMARQMIEKSNPELAQQIPDLQSLPNDPEDLEELELMSGYTYRSVRASKMKKVLSLIHQNNDFDQVQKLWDKDCYDFGVMVGKDDIDSNGNVILRRVNPMNMICSIVQRNDFTDAYYWGEIREGTIQQLKEMAQGQFTEQQYEEIAKKTSGTNYNSWITPYPPTPFSMPYDSQLISFLDIEFSTIWYVDGRPEQSEGTLYDQEKELGERLYSGNVPFQRKAYKIWMKAKWIMGTDYMFDYGPATNMKRSIKSLSNAHSSYHAFAPDFNNMKAVSRVQRAMPVSDSICLSWYKLQNEMSRTIPSGWAIDETALEEVIIGGQGGAAESKTTIIDEFVQTGVLRYRSANLTDGTQGKIPIEPLRNGLSADVTIYYNKIMQDIKLMRFLLGVNDVADGSGGADRTTNQGLEMMYEASENSLNDIIQARKFMVEKTSEDCILRAQDVLKIRPIEGYIKALGAETAEFIRADSTLSYDLFGIKVKDKPDAMKLARFEQMITDAYAKQEVDASDIFIMESMEDVDQAERYLAYKQKKFRRLEMQKMMQQKAMDMQVMQQEMGLKTQAKVAEIEAAAKAKIAVIEAQKQWEYKIEQLKLQGSSMVQQMKSEALMQKEQQSSETKRDIATMKHVADVLTQSQANT